jgi:hypothetical protein
MVDAHDHIDAVGGIAESLKGLGVQPVLIGGMALVLLGSRRVTADFDFVVEKPAARLQSLVDLFYDRGFELASHLNSDGDIISTIDNRRVAAIRLRIDQPAGAFFFNRRTLLRINLLFDFPIAAATLSDRATRLKVRSHDLVVACEADLLEMKRMARADRDFAGDAQDIEFLEARRRKEKRAASSARVMTG